MKRLAPLLAFTLIACGSRPEGPYGIHTGDHVDFYGSSTLDGTVTAIGEDWFEVDGRRVPASRLYSGGAQLKVTCPHD